MNNVAWYVLICFCFTSARFNRNFSCLTNSINSIFSCRRQSRRRRFKGKQQSGKRWTILQIGTTLLPRVLHPTHHRAGARLPPDHHHRYAPVSRARFSSPLLALRPSAASRAPSRPPRPTAPPLSPRSAPPHCPAQRNSLEPSDFPAVRQTAATSSCSYASLLCPVL